MKYRPPKPKGQPFSTSTRVPASACPLCGYKMNYASTDGNRPPRPGDFSVCIKCGGIARFGPDLRLVATTAPEIEASGLARDLRRMRLAIEAAHHQEKAKTEPPSVWIVIPTVEDAVAITRTTNRDNSLQLETLAVYETARLADQDGIQLGIPFRLEEISFAAAAAKVKEYGLHAMCLKTEDGRILLIGDQGPLEEVFPGQAYGPGEKLP